MNINLATLYQQRSRWTALCNRHVKQEDADLTDRQFIEKMIDRLQRELDAPLVDPNE